MASDSPNPNAAFAADSPTPPSGPEAAALGDFRVDAPGEILALLRGLQTEQTPVVLSSAGGAHLEGTLCSIDSAHGALAFDLRADDAQLPGLLGTDEVTVVAYLENIRLQFELDDLMLVNSPQGTVLRGGLPARLYRFQRRQAFRVRPNTRTPQARLQHPQVPELALRLRVLDLSIGGLALLLPPDAPALAAGSLLPGVQIELDRDTRFKVDLRLQHVHPGEATGSQLGLAFVQIEPEAARELQRYIDQTQKLSRLLRKP